jgi:hypothetical protein
LSIINRYGTFALKALEFMILVVEGMQENVVGGMPYIPVERGPRTFGRLEHRNKQKITSKIF